MASGMLSTAVATERAHPDRYEKDFDAVVTFLTHYINKRGPPPSVKVASIVQTRPAKQQKTRAIHDTFQGKNELKKYLEKSMTQYQWPRNNSHMSSGTRQVSKRVRRPQKAAELLS